MNSICFTYLIGIEYTVLLFIFSHFYFDVKWEVIVSLIYMPKDRLLFKMCIVRQDLGGLKALQLFPFFSGSLKFKLCQRKNIYQYMQLFADSGI